MAATEDTGPALSMLLVEDEPEARRMTARLIVKKFPDLLVETTGTGREGVLLFKEHRHDLVITDINMPVMDGLQMVREIKAIKRDTRFIVLSGYSDREHLDEVNAIGVHDYIVKPFHFQKVFAAIDSCIAEIGQERR